MQSLYLSYVRPILRSVVWNQCLLKDNMTIESVQRKFTKRLPKIKTPSYHQRLDKCGIGTKAVVRRFTFYVGPYKLVLIIDLKLYYFFIPNFQTNKCTIFLAI